MNKSREISTFLADVPEWQLIEIIEKQIPKKPITDGITAKEFCPNCKKQLRTFINVENNFFTGYTRERIYPNYCEDCGQAIDWGNRCQC